tara:strand:- start:815 stop:967 length:153 start_codon:yes stop_codon:yes gene_type:complete
MISLKNISKVRKNIFLIFYFTGLKSIIIELKKNLTLFSILKKIEIKEIIF